MVRAEPASVLLEKAIHQEQAVGDLDAAMKIYRKIVDDARANRPHVAEAHYRLGVCYLKKKQHARATAAMKELIRLYPEQKELVGKARRALATARGRLTGAEVSKIVTDAVNVIATCAETDPRLAKALESLSGLNGSAVVDELVKHLAAEKNVIRRAAVFALWKGDIGDVRPAVPSLLKLCSHKEALTRGMAALTRGGKKVDSGYERLCEMALKDADGYARRCAAYALGLLGRDEARGVLEKVLKDKDQFVRGNAEAALAMLSEPEATVAGTATS